ncbi:MAG: hypothetical protein ACM32O_07750 [Clostridia bacterium]
MDIDKSLKGLKEAADQELLKDVIFTSQMQRDVRERTKQPHFDRKASKWKWASGLVTAFCIVVLLITNMPLDVTPSAVPSSTGGMPNSSVPAFTPPSPSTPMPADTTTEKPIIPSAAKWQPSALHTGQFEGKSFQYYGEKPVRVITGEMYEDQGQKTMFLLNGAFTSGDNVRLIGENQQGDRLDLGERTIGGKLYDAEGHFPTSIVLPSPGVWKVEVRYNGEVLGNIFLEIKNGVSPANQSLVEPIITEFLKTSNDFAWTGNRREVSLRILGVDSPDASQKMGYAVVRVEAAQGTDGGAFHAPMKFNIVYSGNQYRVIDYQMPEDGNQYWMSIRAMFPEKYVKKLQLVLKEEAEGQLKD